MGQTETLSIKEGAQMEVITKQDGADIKSEIIKWMFFFWIGQIAVLIAAAKLLLGT